MDKMREAFEGAFRVPKGAYYCKARNTYIYAMEHPSRSQIDELYITQQRWMAYQRGFELKSKQEPAFEVQHGPLSDSDGEPEWVIIASLHDWDERNLPHGTKLFLCDQPNHCTGIQENNDGSSGVR